MIKAAICDDEAAILNRLREHISSEFARLGAEISVEGFSSGEEFLSAHNENAFDAVFLDIDMPEIGGFDIAERINSIGEPLIVFVTSHDELVFSSIRFRPFRFIRKAYLENELPETAEAVRNELAKRSSARKFTFQAKNGEVFVDLGAVEYIEIYGHWLKVHIKDDKPLECYGSLSDFEKRLGEFNFVRTHKSYLINCKFIYAIEKNQVVLDDKTAIPLSRYKADAVKSRFKNILRSTL